MTTLTLPPPTFTPVPPPPAAHRQSARPKRNALKLLVTLAVLGLALSAFMIASLALFTDVENVGGNTFSTGTIDLATAPLSAVVTATAMAPGDRVTAPLDMTNSGTLALRYSATSTTTEDVLAAQLVLTVKETATTCDDAGWASGTTVYTGVLGTSGTSVVFGDVTAGFQAGDRTLAPAATEELCIRVELPITATTGGGLTTTATLTFNAEQTANN